MKANKNHRVFFAPVTVFHSVRWVLYGDIILGPSTLDTYKIPHMSRMFDQPRQMDYISRAKYLQTLCIIS